LTRRTSSIGASKITVLDFKRANNLAIMLSRFKMSVEDLRGAILSLNEKVVSLEDLLAIFQFLPSDDDMHRIAAHATANGSANLAKPELFLLELHRIPNLKKRLESFINKRCFDEGIMNLERNVEDVIKANTEVLASGKLIRLLEVVLAVGNFLNGGTFRGAAYGYKLDCLNKLSDTKANDNTTTLLTYIVRFCDASLPDVLTFPLDLPTLPRASKVSLKQMESEFADFAKDLKQISDYMGSFDRATNLNLGHQDRFHDIMSLFLPKAAQQMEVVQNKLCIAGGLFKNIAAFFGDETPLTAPDDFLLNLHRFVAIWETARMDLARDKLLQEKRYQRDNKKRVGSQSFSGPLLHLPPTRPMHLPPPAMPLNIPSSSLSHQPQSADHRATSNTTSSTVQLRPEVAWAVVRDTFVSRPDHSPSSASVPVTNTVS